MKKFCVIAKYVGFGLACGYLGATIQQKRDIAIAKRAFEKLTEELKEFLESERV